jgi:hypothetical protein
MIVSKQQVIAALAEQRVNRPRRLADQNIRNLLRTYGGGASNIGELNPELYENVWRAAGGFICSAEEFYGVVSDVQPAPAPVTVKASTIRGLAARQRRWPEATQRMVVGPHIGAARLPVRKPWKSMLPSYGRRSCRLSGDTPCARSRQQRSANANPAGCMGRIPLGSSHGLIDESPHGGTRELKPKTCSHQSCGELQHKIGATH